jgi:hypothetical protein
VDFRSARIEGVTFHRRLPAGEYGFQVGPHGVSGLDGVDMRMEQIEIPGGHGSFALPGYLSSRAVSISGTALARSPQHLRALRDKLLGVLASGGLGRLVIEYDESYRLDVQLASKTKFEVFGLDGVVAAFQIQFWAPEPRMLSSKVRTFGPVLNGTVVPVYQRGNVESPPSFEVKWGSGTIANYAVYNGPLRYFVTKPLLDGHPHTIRMDSGDLIVDGQVVLGGRADAVTWDIKPGDPQNHFLDAPGGNAYLTTLVRDAIA